MSRLVDMWTSEVAKLREKGQTIFSTNNAESSHKVQAKKEGGPGGSTGLVQAFSRFKRLNSPVMLYSEASISMLVECFSA